MEQLDQHKKSKNHKKSEKDYLGERKDKDQSEVMSSMFQNITASDKNSQKANEDDEDEESDKSGLILKTIP